MADLNSGVPIKFSNDAKVEYDDADGTTFADTVRLLVPGSVTLTAYPRLASAVKEYGAYTGTVVLGDEQMQALEFAVWQTPESYALEAKFAAEASGLKTLKAFRISQPSVEGGSTGVRWALQHCFLDPAAGIVYQPNPGGGGEEDFNQVRFRFLRAGGKVTPATY